MSGLTSILDAMQLPSFSSLLLFLAFVLATTLSYFCFTPPNPTPRALYPRDTLFALQALHDSTRHLGTLMLAFAWTYYLVILAVIMVLPSSASSAAKSGADAAAATFPPALVADVCANPAFLSPAMFAWSPYTIAFLATIFVFGPLRLNAYRHLGSSFTFELAKPQALVTTGIYAYVQHPSYTGLAAVNAANHFFLHRLDGVAACVLPAWIVGPEGPAGDVWRAWFNVLSPAATSVFIAAALWVRVRDEEEMLRSAFGDEWEAWHKRTKRFVPWLF